MSREKTENSPFGAFSLLGHNAVMPFDPSQRREALNRFILKEGLKVSRWEKDAGVGDGTLRKFLSGASNTLTDKTLAALLSAAERILERRVEASELQAVTKFAADEMPRRSDVRRVDPDSPIPHSSDMARDVPVYGTVSGGAGGLQMGDDSVLDWVRRPPRFKERKGTPKDIFAVLVEEVSMAPRYGPGDLLFIDPLRAPQIGDCVVVEIKEEENGEQRAILKVLHARTASKITLEQYNPPRTFDVKQAHVVRMYRVMTTNDLLGV